MTIISKLNKAFENRIRLGVMSILMVNDSVDFSSVKELLDVTDGNLSSHLKALENSSYILSTKQFIGRKPNTQYKITDIGRKAFQEHLSGLEELLR